MVIWIGSGQHRIKGQENIKMNAKMGQNGKEVIKMSEKDEEVSDEVKFDGFEDVFGVAEEDLDMDEVIKAVNRWLGFCKTIEKDTGDEIKFFDFYGKNWRRSVWIAREALENSFDEDFSVDVREV